MLVSTFVRSFCALFLSTSVVLADQHEIHWYDVEVVVFENVDTPESPNTHWSAQAYTPLLNNAVLLGTEDESVLRARLVDIAAITDDEGELAVISLAPRMLAPETHRLADEAAAIIKSSRYKLLVHQAWRQAGTSREQAIPIHIQYGDPIPAFERIADPESEASQVADPETEASLVADPETEASLVADPGSFISSIAENLDLSVVYTTPHLDTLESTQAAPPPIESVDNFRPVFANPPDNDFGAYTQTRVYPLDGTITVALRRFLHVYTDLALTKTGLSNFGYTLQSFIVKSHRRMRSRTLHYIDHPKIGMLVLITPHEPEQDS